MTGRAVIVLCCACACNAVSGASDLFAGEDPSEQGGPRETSDPTTPEVPGPPASSAAPTPPPTRIKDITFEDKALTHPASGYERVSGPLYLETAGAIAGACSSLAVIGAFGEQTFPAEPTLFVTASVRFDVIVGASRIFALVLEGNATIDLFVAGAAQGNDDVLQLRVNGSTSSAGPPVGLGKTYRLGLRYRAQEGDVAVYVANVGGVFGSGSLLSTGTKGKKAVAIRAGVLAGTGTTVAYDDVRLDRASLP